MSQKRLLMSILYLAASMYGVEAQEPATTNLLIDTTKPVPRVGLIQANKNTGPGGSVSAKVETRPATPEEIKSFAQQSAERDAERAEHRKEELDEVRDVPCPDHSKMIDARIEAHVETLGPQGPYRYHYRVTNGVQSRQSIVGFVVDTDTPSASVRSIPRFWRSQTYLYRPQSVGWRFDEFVEHGHPLKPGASLDSFAFDSPDPPGLQAYFIEGDIILSPAFDAKEEEIGGESMLDEMSMKCPDYALSQRFPDGWRSGIILAPSHRVQTRAEVERSVQGSPTQIRIVANTGFDGAAVDPSSISLWPAEETLDAKRLGQETSATGLRDLLIDVRGVPVEGSCEQRDVLIEGRLQSGARWMATFPSAKPDCLAARASP